MHIYLFSFCPVPHLIIVALDWTWVGLSYTMVFVYIISPFLYLPRTVAGLASVVHYTIRFVLDEPGSLYKYIAR